MRNPKHQTSAPHALSALFAPCPLRRTSRLLLVSRTTPDRTFRRTYRNTRARASTRLSYCFSWIESAPRCLKAHRPQTRHSWHPFSSSSSSVVDRINLLAPGPARPLVRRRCTPVLEVPPAHSAYRTRPCRNVFVLPTIGVLLSICRDPAHRMKIVFRRALAIPTLLLLLL